MEIEVNVTDEMIQKAIDKAAEKRVSQYLKENRVRGIIESCIYNELRKMSYPQERIQEMMKVAVTNDIANRVAEGLISRIESALSNNDGW